MACRHQNLTSTPRRRRRRRRLPRGSPNCGACAVLSFFLLLVLASRWLTSGGYASLSCRFLTPRFLVSLRLVLLPLAWPPLLTDASRRPIELCWLTALCRQTTPGRPAAAVGSPRGSGHRRAGISG